MALRYTHIKDAYGNGTYVVDCLESDAKPINPPNGCTVREIDTGRLFTSNNGNWNCVIGKKTISATPPVGVIYSQDEWIDTSLI